VVRTESNKGKGPRFCVLNGAATRNDWGKKERGKGKNLMEADRIWKGSMLITINQARLLIRRGGLVKICIVNRDGVYVARIKASNEGGDQTYSLGNHDLSKEKEWTLRERAVNYLCRYLGIPETAGIEFSFNRRNEDVKKSNRKS